MLSVKKFLNKYTEKFRAVSCCLLGNFQTTTMKNSELCHAVSLDFLNKLLRQIQKKRLLCELGADFTQKKYLRTNVILHTQRSVQDGAPIYNLLNIKKLASDKKFISQNEQGDLRP
jgi:hypothetical protein